jgi:hypothetical protein
VKLRSYVLFAAALAGCSEVTPEIGQKTSGLTFDSSLYIPVQQFRQGLSDPTTDGQNNAREIVGTSAAPSFYVYTDGSSVFFRLRLDTDPAQNATALRSFGWGVLIDTDSNFAAYEYSIMVEGVANQLVYGKNTSPTNVGDPADVADTILYTAAIDMTTAAMNARVLLAGDSTFNGTPDYFLDFAIPLSVMISGGLNLTDSFRYMAGTSNNGRSITVDLAGSATQPGPNTIQLGATDVTLLDGTSADPDNDGIPNATDLDDDQDGIPDIYENSARINPDADHDSDGRPNWSDASDRGDGIAAGCTDTASDGLCDAPAAIFDEDGDTFANHLDLDSDNDAIADLDESGHRATDANNDGMIDGAAGFNGLIDSLETSAESGVITYVLLNTDGGGLPDFKDLDSDNDGAFDISEVGRGALDSNNDGRINGTTDADRDGLRSVADANDSAFGHPQLRVRNFDADGDTIPNPADADNTATNDSDDDGLTDTAECAGGWPCPDANNDGAPNYMTGSSDVIPPTVTISSMSPNPTSGGVNVIWYASEGGGYTVYIGGTSCGTGTLVASGTYSAPNATTTPVLSASLASGSNNVRVCLVDASNNSGSALATVTKNTSLAPAVVIAGVSPSPTNAGTTLTWSANENGAYTVRIGATDCATGTQIASGTYTAPNNLATVIASGNLVSGVNTIRVCLTNGLGTQGFASTSVIQDATAPTVSITSVSPSPTSGGTTVTWTAYESGPYTLRVGGTTCTTGTVLTSGFFTLGNTLTTYIASSSLVLGSNTIRACVTDAAGNVGSATQTITKDTTSAPGVTIVSTSPNPTNAGTTITWYGSDTGTYNVRVSGTSCTTGTVVIASTAYSTAGSQIASVIPSASLATGANTLRVCLVNGGAVTGSASVTVNKDVSTPSVSITSVSPNPTTAGTTVSWSGTESGTFALRVGGTDCSTGTIVESGSYVSGTLATAIAASDLPGGLVTLRLCLSDSAGNTGSAASSVTKNQPPVVAIAGATPNPTAAGTTIAWSADQSGTYSVRTGATSCVTGTELAGGAYTTPSSINTVIPSGNLVAGNNTIYVCVTSGNGTGSSTFVVVKDLTAPVVSINGATPNPTTSGTTITWSADESGTYSVRAGGTDCSTGTVLESGAYTSGFRATVIAAGSLAEGANTIRVCVVDAVSNAGNNTVAITRDSTGPNVSISGISPNPTDAGATVSWSANESGTYSVRVGGVDCTTGTVVASGSYTSGTLATVIAAGSLAEGSNTVRICMVDALNNAGSTSGSVSKDTVAPVVAIAGASPNPTPAGTSLTWSADEDGDYTVRVGGSGCSDGTELESGTYTASGQIVTAIGASELGGGSNTVRVCVTDAAGNVDAETIAVVKQTNDPLVSIACAALGPTSNAETLTWSADRSGAFSVRLGSTSCADGQVIESGSYTTGAAHNTVIPTAGLVDGNNALRVCVDNGFALASVVYHAAAYVDLMQQSAARTFSAVNAPQYFTTMAVGDLTGDGVADLVTAEWDGRPTGAAPLVLRAGTLYGYEGGAGFFNAASTVVPAGVRFQIRGGDRDDGLGVRLSRMFAGVDVTGDGVGDLVVSAQNADGVQNRRADAGEIYVLSGGASLSGPIVLSGDAMPSAVYARIIGPAAGGNAVILAVRDADGDGIADLLIGVPLADPSGMTDAGEVYLIAGGATLAGTKDLSNAARIAYFSGAAAGDTLGSNGALGDFGGNGDVDVLLGTRGGGGFGGAHGVFGPLTGVSRPLASSPADVTWSSVGSTKIGQFVAIANVRGDAREEAILAAGRLRAPDGVATGGVEIFTGPVAAGTIVADVAYGSAGTTIFGVDDDDRFGAQLAHGDFDGDGYEDLLVGANAADGAGNAFSSSGNVTISFGAQCMKTIADLSVDTAPYAVDGPGADSHFARFASATAIGDLDNDGKLDFCAGAERPLGGRIFCFQVPWAD